MSSSSLELLTQVENVALSILTKSLPILEQLKTEDNILVDDVIEDLPEKKNERSKILFLLRKEVLDFIADANYVNKEIEKFKSDIKEQNDLDENIDDYPFLIRVWSGDMYDVTEGEALKILLKDLHQRDNDIDNDFFIDVVISKIK